MIAALRRCASERTPAAVVDDCGLIFATLHLGLGAVQVGGSSTVHLVRVWLTAGFDTYLRDAAVQENPYMTPVTFDEYLRLFYPWRRRTTSRLARTEAFVLHAVVRKALWRSSRFRAFYRVREPSC